jgi:aminoglycoside 3-N-acetyltransferase
VETITRLVEQNDHPVTVTRLVADLEQLGVPPGSTLLLHSSLKSLGWVCGGAQAVVEAFELALRSYGTLVMPTQTTHLSDPETWSAPSVPESWWDEIRRFMPAYDPDFTPTAGMGAIPETFRKQPGVLRSSHPHFSFAAWGEGAPDITADHALEYGLGESSPLARLYDADAFVLLLGVGFSVNTSFHLAEYRAEYRTKAITTRHAPLRIEGHRRWKPFEDLAIDSSDFEALGHDFEKHHGKEIRSGRVGNARALLFRQRSCVDYAVSWMHRKRT